MALIIPEFVQVAVHGTFLGNDVVNTFHWKVWSNLPTLSRTDVIEELQDKIPEGWKAHVVTHLSNQYVFRGWTMTDLNEAQGRVWDGTENQQGGQPNEALPSNVAVRVIKNSERRNGLRQGSFYIGGLTEASTAGNQMAPEPYTNLQNSLNSLHAVWSNTAAAPVIGDAGYEPYTVHQKAGQVYVSRIGSFGLQRALSHQDRRMQVR